MPTIMGRNMKYYFCGSQLYNIANTYQCYNENSIHIYCICYPSNCFGFKFYKPVSFSFFFLIDHGNEYDTIKYKYQIKMKNFRPKIIFLRTIT